MQSVTVLGIGRAGGALALALSRAGHRIDHLVHRNGGVAERVALEIPGTTVVHIDSAPAISSDIVLITTADPEIALAAHLILQRLENRPVVLHTSGSLSSEILAEMAAAGCSTGSMHPLISISDAVSGADNFTEAFFCIEGDEKALAAAHALVKSLGGQPFSILSQDKPLYHASAVTACGHLIALIDIAIEMLSKCGIPRERAKAVLFPLVESTIRNLESEPPERALTGTFARADAGALDRHLDSIDESMSKAIRDIYLLLGERSLDLAAANGADRVAIQRMRERIRVAKRKPE